MQTVKTAAFLGDSITMGYGLENAADRFSTVFCGMAGVRELNYGITGTLMARAGLSRFDATSFIDRYAAMAPADLVVVFGGTNDYFWTDAPIADPVSADDCYFTNAVRRLCRGLRERYPGAPVVFLLPYQMRGVGNYLGGTDARASSKHNTDQPNFVGCTLADYVRAQTEICAQNGVPALDLFHALPIDVAHAEADEARYTLDGCHPNPEGHRLIARTLFDFCKTQGIL